jgi:hypothetical protein
MALSTARPARQTSLFGDAADAPNTALSLSEALSRTKPENKAQAAFQRLVAQIEQQRALLLRWQDYGARYNQRLSLELMPLQEKYWQRRRDLAHLFDETLQRPGGRLGKRQRAELQRVLIDLIRDLLQSERDAELEAIHDRHSNLSYAEDRHLDMAMSQNAIENLFGVDLGEEHGAASMEELFAKAGQEAQARAKREAEKREQRRAKRRKTPKMEEAEARREQAAKETSQSVREVYRKLASALHPDRESDPAVRQRRTEQMQRVNLAYEAGDLLGLLNIQLEIEQIDADHLATLSAQRLDHYLGILREQLKELKAEIQTASASFQFAAPFKRTLSPEDVDRALTADIAELAAAIAQIEADLVDLKDVEKLKAMLKEIRELSDCDEFDELVEMSLMMDAFASSAPSRRKRKK